MNNIIAGTKVNGRYNRELTSFNSPVEFGVAIPINDHKFLYQYEIFTVNADHGPLATQLFLNDDNLAENYIISNYYTEDLDGNKIRSFAVGPSTYAGVSKGLTQMRCAKRLTDTSLEIHEDIPWTLKMFLRENDTIFAPRFPMDWTLNDYANGFTIRTPKMINVKNHANSLIFNMPVDSNLDFDLPMTDQGTIHYTNNYRFGFYYRINGSVSFTITVNLYTNTGSFINSMVYSKTYTGSDTEDSDFNYDFIAIPISESLLQQDTKRLSINFFGSSSSELSIFEMAYPVIETAYETEASSGFISIPEPPESISYERVYPNKLDESSNGTNIPSWETIVHPHHIGRKLYNINLKYSMLDAAYCRQLKAIENMNMMGYYCVIRPKYANLPPVLIGNINIEDRLNSYDYNNSDVSISFTEIA